MAIVSPLPHQVEEHARILLEEAGDYPHLVATTMDGPTGLAFIVPDDIAERYLARIHGKQTVKPKAEPAEATQDDPGLEETPEEVAVPAKRRGRPPGSKNKATSTDGAD